MDMVLTFGAALFALGAAFGWVAGACAALKPVRPASAQPGALEAIWVIQMNTGGAVTILAGPYLTRLAAEDSIRRYSLERPEFLIVPARLETPR